MNEQGWAFVQLIIVAVICGPFYLSLLIYGYIRRKKLVLHPLATWIYIASFPLALVSISLIQFLGTEAINTVSETGGQLSSFALTCLIAGVLAAIYIAVSTLRARRATRRTKNN